MASEKSFIEVQFPVSKVSKESYKERMAGNTQTLTALGKWWGRKPLIVIRAALLGLLMKSSLDPQKDLEIFLKVLTMDDEGLWLRKDKQIPATKLYELSSTEIRNKNFQLGDDHKVKYKKGINNAIKNEIQKNVFHKMSYGEKLQYCQRPEQIIDTRVLNWSIINDYLGTSAQTVRELFQELGAKKFNHIPTVGDCFCGGGSIPFESAKLGLNVYASDLNPIAASLTWASLNILGGSEEKIEKLKEYQKKVYKKVDEQITVWGIEHNEQGMRANAYLYCVETRCLECNYLVPLAPSWVIGKSSKTVAILSKDDFNKRYDIQIKTSASQNEYEKAEKAKTIIKDHLYCPNCKFTTPLSAIRAKITDNNQSKRRLCSVENSDFASRSNGVFIERLYCIRYILEDSIYRGKNQERIYVTPTDEDIIREQKVFELLKDRFKDWQDKGYIPSQKIEEGYNTSQVIRERGWEYWYQLFNPRQLLINGLLLKTVFDEAQSADEKVLGLININKCIDWNSRLSRWVNDAHTNAQTFYNQAFNTLYNYSVRALVPLREIWYTKLTYNSISCISKEALVETSDARNVKQINDIWITDPPYADAVYYHELSEFFLSWVKVLLNETFPSWHSDSKRTLAIKGVGANFNYNMIDIYSNLANHMADNGMQIVMFTHQDVKVWAELSLILWASKLRVTAAWNIATEKVSVGQTEGNYVKGTVLLVLRKQTSEETAFDDDLYTEIEAEVKRQVDNMRAIDDKEDPNFGDADYLLAAYASSLKVLTSYKYIEGMDIQYELSKDRSSGEPSPVERMIRSAVKIAYDYLIPANFDSFIWKLLSAKERFYIKGLEAEKHGSTQLSTYQELARGFGVNDYKEMMADARANNARLKTASEYKMAGMQNDEAKVSVIRNLLVAIHRGRAEEDPVVGKNWLRNELQSYWDKRESIIEILTYITELENHDHMQHWLDDAHYARLIRELVKSDGY